MIRNWGKNLMELFIAKQMASEKAKIFGIMNNYGALLTTLVAFYPIYWLLFSCHV